MRNIDTGSWEALLSTILVVVIVTVLGVGIRLLFMQKMQRRRERENRQINERLRTLISAYKILGGSFTGNLSVDPTHLRELRMRGEADDALSQDGEPLSTERARRTRDAVEAALSDIILLGTEEQVRLAAQAASELTAGRPVYTDELVRSLRDFIRAALDLDPVPAVPGVPRQGPLRPVVARAGGKGEGGQKARAGGAGGMGAGGGTGVAATVDGENPDP